MNLCQLHLCGVGQSGDPTYSCCMPLPPPPPSGSVHVVPTVLVFGIATSTSAVHNSLTQEASSALSIEQFAAQSPIAMLNTIVEEVSSGSGDDDECDGGGGSDDATNFLPAKVLLDPTLPLCLGGGAHHYLVQHFLCSSLSTKELQRGMQVGTHRGTNPPHSVDCY